MLIPSSVKKLKKPYSFFCHSSSEKAIPSKASRFLNIWTVQILNMLRLLRDIHELWNFCLHPKCHFILRNSSLSFRIIELLMSLCIQFLQTVKHSPSHISINTRRVIKIQNWLSRGTQFNSLML